MGDDKKQWSNVIIGPWESKKTPKGKTRDQVIQEEMDAIDDLSQSAMVSMIQILKENDVSISSKDFYRHIGFMNETLKAYLFKGLGYDHPLSDLVNYIILPMRGKDDGDIYTKFRADLIEETSFFKSFNSSVLAILLVSIVGDLGASAAVPAIPQSSFRSKPLI